MQHKWGFQGIVRPLQGCLNLQNFANREDLPQQGLGILIEQHPHLVFLHCLEQWGRVYWYARMHNVMYVKVSAV